MSRLVIISLALGLLGCWGPTAEGRLTCGPAGECPSGWYCHTGNRCWSTPADAAEPSDANLPEDASDPEGGPTVVYVLSGVEAPAPVDMTLPGFDLDRAPGGVEGRCDSAPADFTSSVIGAPNVDNQFGARLVGLLGGMLDGGFGGAFRAANAVGLHYVLLRLTDVDSYVADERVGVEFVVAALAGARPPMLDASGGLARGQEFDNAHVLGSSEAAIVGGRVFGSLPRLPLRFQRNLDTSFELVLHDGRWAADITADDLTRGELGGRLVPSELVDALEVFGLGFDEATVRGVASPDLLPNADGSTCEGISAGLAFSAVSGTLR